MSEDKEALRKEWEAVFKQWPPSMWSDESFEWFYTKLKNQAEECGSVMIAAAEEIQEHWQAHCDEDGYGPANLMHRLEHGIAAYYPGYSFGSFTNDLQKEFDGSFYNPNIKP